MYVIPATRRVLVLRTKGLLRAILPWPMVAWCEAIYFALFGEIELRMVRHLCRPDQDSIDVGANIGTYLQVRRVRAFFHRLGYRGYFVFHRHLKAIEQFDAQTMQRSEDIADYTLGAPRAIRSLRQQFPVLTGGGAEHDNHPARGVLEQTRLA